MEVTWQREVKLSPEELQAVREKWAWQREYEQRRQARALAAAQEMIAEGKMTENLPRPLDNLLSVGQDHYYGRRPEAVRAKERERYRTPKRQAWLAAYRQRPEVQARQREYDSARAWTPKRWRSRFRYESKRRMGLLEERLADLYAEETAHDAR